MQNSPSIVFETRQVNTFRVDQSITATRVVEATPHRDVGVSRPKEFHLRPLAEPDVNLSAHPAPTIHLRQIPQRPMNERTRLTVRELLERLAARVLWPASLLCLRMNHRIRNRFMLRHTGLSADP